jgi:hypothetical protein
MPKKRKPKPFRVTKAVKAAARAVVGTPPPTQTIPNKRQEKQAITKHKRNLARLLEENQV